MPRLLAFLPCEKVIIGQDGNPSVISILQQFNVPLPAGAKVDPHSMGMFRWDIFSLWERLAGDEEKEFEQRCELISPDGRKSVEAVLKFKFVASMHRNV